MQLLTVDKLGILLGLSFFFGLSFEGFYWKSGRCRPGGIRTFPLISLSGAILYALEPQYAAAFCVGLLVLAIWLYPYYRDEVADHESASETADGIMVPMCNLVAYLLGPVAVVGEPWLAIAINGCGGAVAARSRSFARLGPEDSRRGNHYARTVSRVDGCLAAVVAQPARDVADSDHAISSGIGRRRRLDAFVRQLFAAEASSPHRKLVSDFGARRIVFVNRDDRGTRARLKRDPRDRHQFQSGIVLATALMYLRVGVVVAIFNLRLALDLAGPLFTLALTGTALAALCLWLGQRSDDGEPTSVPPPGNPLEFPAALVFAMLFVVISMVSTWVRGHFGHVGVYWLAAIVGVTDIDPFVLSVAQGSLAGLDQTATAIAILVAASSNNALKAIYAVVFAGWNRSRGIVWSLVLLGLLGGGLCAWLALHGLP